MQNSYQPPDSGRSNSDSMIEETSSTEHTTPDSDSWTQRTRREFLAETTAVGVGLALEKMASAEALPAGSQVARSTAGEVPVNLQINGKAYPLNLEPRVSLLDAIREQAYLTGTKKGCDHGQCGACTVHIEGRRVLSCLTLAVMHEGQSITTIEGLAEGDKLHPMQAAFLSHDGFQCGFCTPGQIMSAVGMVQEGHAHADEEIRESMSGNICRCGAYPNILTAIRDAMEGKKDASV